jgi:hypothetical protein
MIHYVEPVVGKEFFARGDILKSLHESAKGIQDGYRRNIALIGSGLIGKSSLLLQFLSNINSSDKLLPVYLNLKNVNFEEFAHSFMTKLLYHSLKKHKQLKEPRELDYLLKSAQKVFPKTHDLIKRVKMLIIEKNYDDAFSEAWDLNVILSAESGYFPIIVLDEFSLLSTFPVKRPYQVLGQKIMVQQKTLFLLSSSCRLHAREILSKKLSLLFGGFKVIDIGAFNPSEAKGFLLEKCKDVIISNEIRDFILTFTGGHPFYLSSIIRKIHSARSYGTDRITIKNLSLIIAELLFYPGGTIAQFFTNMLSPIHTAVPGMNILDILISLVKPVRVKDVLCKYIISETELSRILNSLLELGMISKSGALYTVTDAVFRMWIEVKSKPRNLCFGFIPDKERANYAGEVEERIVHFYSERKKGLDKRIIELISSFNDDQFFIDERVRVLPRVGSIQLKRLDHNNFLITAKGKKRCLFVVSRKEVTEEDVYIIFNKIRSLRYDKPKVMLLAPMDIDEQAKLLAKQKQFWIWTKDDIARLFEFYKGYNALIA